MQLPLKVNKVYFFDMKHGLTILKTKVQYLWHTYLWLPIPWHRKAMEKELVKLWPPNFQKILL